MGIAGTTIFINMDWALLNTRNTKVAILHDCIYLQEDNIVKEAILNTCEINQLWLGQETISVKDFYTLCSEYHQIIHK